MKIMAVLLAAGNSSRFGENKMLYPISGKTPLELSLSALLSCYEIERIAIVVSDSTRNSAKALIDKLDAQDRAVIVEGGEQRSDSVYNGLQALRGTDIAIIHDGARCLIKPEIIRRSIESAVIHGSGVVCIAAVDSLKRVECDKITATIPRSGVYQAQTPQTFKYQLILNAYERARESGISATDDAELLEKLGDDVFIVEGSPDNIKLTTKRDVIKAEAILSENAASSNNCNFRIGYGNDMHKLVHGRLLILGGVKAAHTTGLLGHSDADVLTHAIIDALLGALAWGDIGKWFPDSDDRYKDANSLELLSHVCREIIKNNFYIVNVDATIVAQQPKLAPYVDEMRLNLAKTMEISIDQVSVKATTSEGLGPQGRGEGISAHAVALLAKKTK